jgi:hypothetical protein
LGVDLQSEGQGSPRLWGLTLHSSAHKMTDLELEDLTSTLLDFSLPLGSCSFLAYDSLLEKRMCILCLFHHYMLEIDNLFDFICFKFQGVGLDSQMSL